MGSSKFGPRTKAQRKQRSLNRAKYAATEPDDSNAAEIFLAETKNERAQRKQALRESLAAENGQMSSKKRKRLDKYVEKKLRKDENLELIKKLAKSKTDTSFLRSSRSFGGVDKRPVPENYLGPPIVQKRIVESSSEDEGDDRLSQDAGPHTVSAISENRKLSQAPPVAVGSGLKRPLEKNVFGGPVIRKRIRTKPPTPEPDIEVPWEGFSSDESNPDRSSENPTSGASDDSDPGLTESEDDPNDDDDDDSEDFESEDEEEVNNIAASMLAAIAKKKAERDIDTKQPSRDVSAWKTWATEQLNEARDFAPTRVLDEIQSAGNKLDTKTIEFEPRAPEQDELPPELRQPSARVDRQVYTINVQRPSDVQDARLKLPIVAEEQKIMEAIHNNPITIVCGATGSGKTTQIPQFLFEAGYGDPEGPTPGMVAVTQPRRVAAVTMAKRVAHELGEAGSKVAYQIRYGSTVGEGTALKFMTDGILIREIATDFSLSKYSAIVIDEAHERSVNTDILIGMLSRIVDLRENMRQRGLNVKPLKLIIMSATLMVKAFTENPNLFKRGPPPLVESEGRQYPVTMHFARRTQRDYLEETFKKVMRGHKKLPPGAILVFLTGENEIIGLSKKLKEALGKTYTIDQAKVRVAALEAPLETEDFDTGAIHDFAADEDDTEDMSEGEEEQEFDVELDEDSKDKNITDALILPLYSKLPTKDQLRVFEPPPESTRLIVLSTNVAETSVTIPGVRYVFDCGRSKEKKYNQSTGVQSFEIDWISKASAAQRAGRAGRTGPGHCYRLYSSAVYERDFADHTKPEILRMPVEGVVLQLKSMDLQHVVKFPFPTPPDQNSIIKAERLLSHLMAIDSAGKITSVGRDLSLYPLSPRYAKMLAVGHQHGCMLLTTAMVAALATPELFVPENQVNADDSEIKDNDGLTAGEQRRKAYRNAHHAFSGWDDRSDALKMLTAFAAYASAEQRGEGEAFCNARFLRSKSLKEASQLFHQLIRIVADNRPGLLDPSASTIPLPTDKQVSYLKQFVAAGFIDQVAMRADLAPVPPDLPKGRRATEVPYVTLFPSHEGRTDSPEERAVYVHASSVITAKCKPTEMPQYLIYSHLQQSSATGSKVAKIRMHPLTSVTAAQLAALAKGTPLLEYGKPIGKIEPVPGDLNRRTCWVVPSLVGRKGLTSWPLPARKVVQKRGTNGAWEVERMAP